MQKFKYQIVGNHQISPDFSEKLELNNVTRFTEFVTRGKRFARGFWGISLEDWYQIGRNIGRNDFDNKVAGYWQSITQLLPPQYIYFIRNKWK